MKPWVWFYFIKISNNSITKEYGENDST